MSSVRASVVIPFTAPEMIGEACVRSALASTLSEIEVIAVGVEPSDVASLGKLDPRVIPVRLRSGCGELRALNVGIARARAPYVALVHPHERLTPRFLAAAVAALDGHQQAGFAVADYSALDERGNVMSASSRKLAPSSRPQGGVATPGAWQLADQAQLVHWLLYADADPGLSGLAIRTRLFSELGPLDEALTTSAGLDLWFRLAHHGGAVYCDDIGHTQTPDGAARGSETAARSASARISALQREQARQTDPAAQRQLQRLIADSRGTLARAEYLSHRRLHSAAMFLQAFAAFPDRRWLLGALRALLP